MREPVVWRMPPREPRVVASQSAGAAEAAAEDEEEDVVAEAAGDCGPWQWRLTALLSLFYLPSTWHMTVITFQLQEPPFFCPQQQVVPNIYFILVQLAFKKIKAVYTVYKNIM